ncbi:unnamed protein product [Schistosoma margrebowiei]|uniref:Uncharacterized protein n=1 Tax=Schistosoma margrebowiei TaxID=48269 RepID=A0A183LBW4_9TREM|nr:unnamed protein product [Schistosoma margrebowiei]
MKLKLKKHWTAEETAVQSFNTAFLTDTDELTELMLTLNNRLKALQDLLKEEQTKMENNWRRIKQVLTLACQTVVGRKKHHPKEWISMENLFWIQERENKRTAINNSWTRTESVGTSLLHWSKQTNKRNRAL